LARVKMYGVYMKRVVDKIAHFSFSCVSQDLPLVSPYLGLLPKDDGTPKAPLHSHEK